MKESKFIELLNLYIDREISPEEAAQLEAAIQADPERRRVYQQYCRMHRASTVLFESFRAESVPAGSKLAEAARAADERVIAFPGAAAPRSTRWLYATGALAAAACAAFVFLRPTAGWKETIGQASLAQSVAAPATAQTLKPATPSASSLYAVLNTTPPRAKASMAGVFTTL